MGDFQPDEHPAIQRFLRLYRTAKPGAIWRTGRSGSDNEIESWYVSLKTLEQDLTHERIETLLEALFENWSKPAPDAGTIRKYHLRSFTILLCIGAGRFIEYFKDNHTLRDSCLPFYKPPHNFPGSTTRDLFQDFNNAQWAFCPFHLEWDMSTPFGTREILPISDVERLEGRGSAVIRKFRVDDEYDDLNPHRKEYPGNNRQNDHTYVLKTYRTREAQKYHETECNAFRRIRFGNRPPEHIVEFYGSFVRGGEAGEKYNIILEYADLKTLDHFMRTVTPPHSTQDKLLLWRNILQIIKGLLTIHGGTESEEGLQIFHGWHQDINPDNILVMSREGRSVYDADFKLADLGLSHFKHHHPASGDVTDQDTFGTSAYGPPEVWRCRGELASHKLRVKQDVDIWSVGCVLSEVAAWVDRDWPQVVEYRRRRSEEMFQQTNSREDCFHNGQRLLDTVSDIHSAIVENCRLKDGITHRIVKDLVTEMLWIDWPRPAAQYLHNKSMIIISEASSPRHSSRDYFDYGPGLRNVLVESDEIHPSRNKHPYSSGASAHSGLRRPILNFEHTDFTYNPYGSQQLPDRHSSMDLTSSPPLHDPRSPIEGNSSSTMLSPRTRLVPGAPLQPLPPHLNGTPRYPQQTQNNYIGGSFFASQLTNEPRYEGEGARSNHPVNAMEEPNNSGDLQYGRPIPSDRPWANPRQDHSMQHRSGGTTLQRDTFYSNRHNASPVTTSNPEHPTMSVAEGLELKQRGSRQTFPDQDLFETLDGRDHVFFIDNSLSMEPYRPHVRRVLDLLTYMLKPSDPDGLDIYFTTERKPIKSKGHSAIMRAFDAKPNRGTPDMRDHFAAFTEDYQSQFDKKNLISRILWRKSTPTKGPRRLNLYVLTNGVWQPRTDLVQEIKTLVKLLMDKSLTNKQIGIQFISFGHDAKGLRRLQKLDSGLKLDLDIVDTTSADDNVWKMLLGAINNSWDDDPNNDEEDLNGEDMAVMANGSSEMPRHDSRYGR